MTQWEICSFKCLHSREERSQINKLKFYFGTLEAEGKIKPKASRGKERMRLEQKIKNQRIDRQQRESTKAKVNPSENNSQY